MITLSNSIRSCLLLGTLLLTTNAFSSGLHLGGNSYDYTTALDGFELDFTAIGFNLGADIDISESGYLQFSYAHAEDDTSLSGNDSADYESDYWSIGLGYEIKDWQLYLSYSSTDDDIEHIHGMMNEFLTTASIDWKSIQVSASYTHEIEAWALTASSGIQYDETEVDAQLRAPNNMQSSDTDAWYFNAKLSADYYIPVSDSALYVGASVNWYEQISGDDFSSTIFNAGGGIGGPPPPPRPGGPGGGGGNRGNGGDRANATSGESYGLFALYLVYDINESWSLDWNSSLGFGGDENSNSHALTLSYFFD